MILQLNPSIPLDTPKGPALAVLVIDMGEEHHLMWVCFQDDTGECWTWPNPQVRAQKNVTMGRTMDGEVKFDLPNWMADGIQITPPEPIRVSINWDWFRSTLIKKGVMTPELDKALKEMEEEDKK